MIDTAPKRVFAYAALASSDSVKDKMLTTWNAGYQVIVESNLPRARQHEVEAFLIQHGLMYHDIKMGVQ